MDDFLKYFGNGEKNEENTASADEVKSNDNDDLSSGEYHYIPPKQEQKETNYYNPVTPPQQEIEVPKKEYADPQQNQNNAYSAPRQSQGYGSYYTPPTYTPNPEPTPAKDYRYIVEPTKPSRTVINGEAEDTDKPKKKNRTIIVIVCVIAICIIVAVVGMVAGLSGYRGITNSSNSGNTESNTQIDDDSASASVESSGGAAKTDKDGNLTAAGVAEKAIDSCVGITVYAQQSAYSYFYNYGQSQNAPEDKVAAGEGSGVIMSESNGTTFIMTCAHVIEGGSSFKVTLNDGSEYDASMVACDSQTDIGVLSIKATGLKVATFGDSKDIELGEECVAIGCPGGLEFMNSVTRGIVSALDRPVSSSIGYSNECIQVDAAINPGNSGGALFNMQGQVIGINSSKIASMEYEGMGFAVPSNTAVETANSLIKNGYVAGRAKLGVSYVSLENYYNASAILSALEERGFKDAKGTMVVQEINNDSDLKNKGLQQYDMIIAVNGTTLTSTDVMTSYLSSSKPGNEATLTVARIENNSIKIFEIKCKLIEAKE